MNQFVVPQFLEVESKIIGPISGRQFLIILVAGGFSFLWFQLFTAPFLWIPLVFLTMGLGGILGFGKVNGQYMHFFLLNLAQTIKRPKIKIWKRIEYKSRIADLIEEAEGAPVRKQAATQSRLASVALMVDTGGAYQGDDIVIERQARAQQELGPQVSPATTNKRRGRRGEQEDRMRTINLRDSLR